MNDNIELFILIYLIITIFWPLKAKADRSKKVTVDAECGGQGWIFIVFCFVFMKVKWKHVGTRKGPLEKGKQRVQNGMTVDVKSWVDIWKPGGTGGEWERDQEEAGDVGTGAQSCVCGGKME